MITASVLLAIVSHQSVGNGVNLTQRSTKKRSSGLSTHGVPVTFHRISALIAANALNFLVPRLRASCASSTLRRCHLHCFSYGPVGWFGLDSEHGCVPFALHPSCSLSIHGRITEVGSNGGKDWTCNLVHVFIAHVTFLIVVVDPFTIFPPFIASVRFFQTLSNLSPSCRLQGYTCCKCI